MDALPYVAAVTEEHFPEAGSPNPVARVGVVDVAGGDVRWMDTGGDPTVLLARVAWLPDSRRLAIQRLNRVQNHLDLLLADVASGKCQTMLTEQDKYWINLSGDGFGPAASDDLHFFADGKRSLWPSERSGFRHLYLYDLAGKQIAQLTRGDWEVESVAKIDEQAKVVNESASFHRDLSVLVIDHTKHYGAEPGGAPGRNRISAVRAGELEHRRVFAGPHEDDWRAGAAVVPGQEKR